MSRDQRQMIPTNGGQATLGGKYELRPRIHADYWCLAMPPGHKLRRTWTATLRRFPEESPSNLTPPGLCRGCVRSQLFPLAAAFVAPPDIPTEVPSRAG